MKTNPIDTRFLRAGWSMHEQDEMPRTTTTFVLARSSLVIRMQYSGDNTGEWTVCLECTDGPTRTFVIGGTPERALSQALTSILDDLDRHRPPLPGVRSAVSRMLKTAPAALKERA